jgi:catechol 2,3-dioxygenase-like lactoylglutathione lyase family enzyme
VTTFEHVFGGIHVSDRDAAVSWYERLFARPPDLIPNTDEAAWRLTETAWVYVIAGAGEAGTSLHTFLVSDLDPFLRRTRGAGIRSGPIETKGGGVRSVYIEDPDGNRLQVGQPPADAVSP